MASVWLYTLVFLLFGCHYFFYRQLELRKQLIKLRVDLESVLSLFPILSDVELEESSTRHNHDGNEIYSHSFAAFFRC